jgi:hypothetical protein
VSNWFLFPSPFHYVEIFWPCKRACSWFQTSNLPTRCISRSTPSRTVSITYEVCRQGKRVAILACACCFIAMFIDTYILKTILEKKGPLSVSERWKECHHIWNPQSKTSKASMILQFSPRFILHLSLSLRMLRQFTIHSISTSSNRFLDLCYSQHQLLPKYPQPFIHSKLLFRKCSLDLSYFGDGSHLNVRMPSRTFNDFRITPLDWFSGYLNLHHTHMFQVTLPQSIKTQRGLGGLAILI